VDAYWDAARLLDLMLLSLDPGFIGPDLPAAA
jgi:hypothetical protein